MKTASEYFPQDYTDSRQRFLSRVHLIDEPKHSGNWNVPSRVDSDLFVDHVYLPALKEPKTLVVITSGIHGSETYAGSAIQAMFMNEVMPKIDRRHTSIFIVHAMNPFGFKHHRRETENNVNLNRNFCASGELFKLKRPEANEFNERFLEKTPVQSMRSQLIEKLSQKNGKFFIEDISIDQFVKTVIPGQFESPNHLEFGGTRMEPQTLALTQWLKSKISDFQDVLLLDLHTGLGHRGRLHLLSNGQPKEVDESLFSQLFDLKKDEAYYEFTPASADGFYETFGTLNGIFRQLATPEQRICALTMEFGTLGHDWDARIESLNRMALRHQGQIYGYANSEIETRVKVACFEKSYPQSDDWRSLVINASRGLFFNVFSRIKT